MTGPTARATVSGHRTLRVGTRGSPLALAQAARIARRLQERCGRAAVLVTVATPGDGSMAPIERLGTTGVFTSTLREALLRGDVDLVVHSCKGPADRARTGAADRGVPGPRQAWLHGGRDDRSYPEQPVRTQHGWPWGRLVGRADRRVRVRVLDADQLRFVTAGPLAATRAGGCQNTVPMPGAGPASSRLGHPLDMETGRRPEFGVCAAVDVHYLRTGGARAAAVLAADARFRARTGRANRGDTPGTALPAGRPRSTPAGTRNATPWNAALPSSSSSVPWPPAMTSASGYTRAPSTSPRSASGSATPVP
jgi:Porphobilinogen deaminase, dipyromethane cofactor binding domain